MHGDERIEAAHEIVEHGDRPVRAEPARQGDEALEVGEQDGRFRNAVGDRLAGPRLEPLDDAVGQDVAQHRLGLRLGARRETERVVGQGGDDAERGDCGGYVELRKKVGRDDQQRPLRRKQEPRGDVQAEAEQDHGDDQRQTFGPEDHERSGGADHQVEVDAGVTAENGDEREQRQRLRHDDEQAAGELVMAMHKRHAQSDRREAQVDGDDRPVGDDVLGRVDERIDRGEDHDQIGHDVEGLEASPHLRRIRVGAEREQPLRNARPAPAAPSGEIGQAWCRHASSLRLFHGRGSPARAQPGDVSRASA